MAPGGRRRFSTLLSPRGLLYPELRGTGVSAAVQDLEPVGFSLICRKRADEHIWGVPPLLVTLVLLICCEKKRTLWNKGPDTPLL